MLFRIIAINEYKFKDPLTWTSFRAINQTKQIKTFTESFINFFSFQISRQNRRLARIVRRNANEIFSQPVESIINGSKKTQISYESHRQTINQCNTGPGVVPPPFHKKEYIIQRSCLRMQVPICDSGTLRNGAELHDGTVSFARRYLPLAMQIDKW